MKALDFNQMEQIEGGWRWGGCISGMALVFYSNSIEVATILGGPVGFTVAVAGSCVAGGLLFDE